MLAQQLINTRNQQILQLCKTSKETAHESPNISVPNTLAHNFHLTQIAFKT